jgi:ribosomal protein S18 acetylase RimI-like enzyme
LSSILSEVTIGLARPEDAAEVARLHAERLRDGFLTSLGRRFLARMYRAMADSPQAVLVVARDSRHVVGFAGAAVSPAGFFGDFLRRQGVRATLAMAPRAVLPGVLQGVLEVLRHLRGVGRGGGPELLSLVVGPPARRMGLGSALVARAEEVLRAGGAQEVTVVVRADNHRIRSFFQLLGYHPMGGVAVHRGAPSLRYMKAL